MSSQPLGYITPEEYLERERHSDRRSEYSDGEIFPVEDASAWHSLILANLSAGLVSRLRKEPCRVYVTALLRIPSANQTLYPDLMVVCGQEQFGDKGKDTLLNPLLIVEVLSKSTADYDREGKFRQYRMLPSLRQFVAVAQDQPLIEVRTRQDDRRWELVYYEGLEQTVPLACADCELSAAEVYDKVDFPAAQAARP